MFIGASRTGYFTPDISFDSDQKPEIRPISESEGPRDMHHAKVKLARKRCPRYQDMDGKCIAKCSGPNTAVGKIFKAVKEGQILDVLTKHAVYNVCYCRGKSCHAVKKIKKATTDKAIDEKTNETFVTAITASGSNDDTIKNKMTHQMLTGRTVDLYTTNFGTEIASLNENTAEKSSTMKNSRGGTTEASIGKTGNGVVVTGVTGLTLKEVSGGKASGDIKWSK